MLIEKKLIKNIDFIFLAVLLSILIISAFVIASASNSVISAQPLYFFKRHVMWIVLSLTAMFGALSVNYVQLGRWQKWIYLVMLLLLIAVLIPGVGREANGAQSWINLGFMDLQPSEFAKVFIIISFAQYLAARQGQLNTLKDFIPAFMYVAVPMLLIMMQPDLGTALVFIGILFGMMFVAGANPKLLSAILIGGILFLVVGIWVHFNITEWLPLKDYQLMRLVVFLDPYNDGMGGRDAGYNLIQSQVAIGSGGILGKGWRHGSQVQGNFLPEHHTDFIFSVIGEELGFIGSALILLLYLLLVYRAILAAFQAKDMFGTLIVIGVTSMMTFHLLVNVGMTIGLMPITGIPLPLMSYGGSSMLANMLALGLILNINMRRQKIVF